MGDYVRNLHGLNGLSDAYRIIEVKQGVFELSCLGRKISEGDEQTIERLTRLHEMLYKEYRFKLPNEVDTGKLQYAIGDLVYYSINSYDGLNVVAHGGSVFIPGNCTVCYQVVTQNQGKSVTDRVPSPILKI